MNRHDESTDRVRAWLHEEGRGELPDWILSKTFETTRSTPQHHGLRGRLASIRGQREPTTRRRLNVLTFAGISAIAAAALLATNVFFQSEDPPVTGAELPVITTEEQMFSGSFTYGPGCVDANGESIDGCWTQMAVTFDDPRFQGIVEMRANSNYTDQGIYRNQFTITTDDGVWVGDPVPGILTRPSDGVPSVHLFEGQGAYDGLHAVASVVLRNAVFEVEGYVVHGGFPELP
jgi:hypothetical protein